MWSCLFHTFNEKKIKNKHQQQKLRAKKKEYFSSVKREWVTGFLFIAFAIFIALHCIVQAKHSWRQKSMNPHEVNGFVDNNVEKKEIIIDSTSRVYVHSMRLTNITKNAFKFYSTVFIYIFIVVTPTFWMRFEKAPKTKWINFYRKNETFRFLWMQKQYAWNDFTFACYTFVHLCLWILFYFFLYKSVVAFAGYNTVSNVSILRMRRSAIPLLRLSSDRRHAYTYIHTHTSFTSETESNFSTKTNEMKYENLTNIESYTLMSTVYVSSHFKLPKKCFWDQIFNKTFYDSLNNICISKCIHIEQRKRLPLICKYCSESIRFKVHISW